MLLKRHFYNSQKKNTNNVHDALRWANSFIKAAFTHTDIQDPWVSHSLCSNVTLGWFLNPDKTSQNQVLSRSTVSAKS